MALDSYAALKASILGWLARPGDPLVEPAVPDMIRLFEVEASRRLKTVWQENSVTLATTGGDGTVVLPADYAEMRAVYDDQGNVLQPLPGTASWPAGDTGPLKYFAIFGNANGNGLWLMPPSDAASTVTVDYLATIPPLSDAAPTNWLLVQGPDAYLYGSLLEAEAYIGHDERIQLWAQRREAAFEALNLADRKYRWSGPMQIRANV